MENLYRNCVLCVINSGAADFYSPVLDGISTIFGVHRAIHHAPQGITDRRLQVACAIISIRCK